MGGHDGECLYPSRTQSASHHLIQPLSVELRRTPTSSPSAPLDCHDSFTPAVQLLHWYHGFGRRGFSFASPSPRAQPRTSVVPIAPPGSRTPKAEGPLELQIAVLVAMPSTVSHTRDRTGTMKGKRTSIEGLEYHQDPGEMLDVAVGVATTPWENERKEFG